MSQMSHVSSRFPATGKWVWKLQFIPETSFSLFSISIDWDSEKARARHSTGSHGGRRMDLGEVGLRSSHVGVAGYENYVCDDLCEVQANVIGLLVLFCTLALPVLLGYGLLHNLDTPSFKGYNEDKT